MRIMAPLRHSVRQKPTRTGPSNCGSVPSRTGTRSDGRAVLERAHIGPDCTRGMSKPDPKEISRTERYPISLRPAGMSGTMASPNLSRADLCRTYSLIGGVDRRPLGMADRVRARIERLPPSVGVVLVIGVGLGLYGGALAGVSVGLAGNGSVLG